MSDKQKELPSVTVIEEEVEKANAAEQEREKAQLPLNEE